MKTSKHFKKLLGTILIVLFIMPAANAQLLKRLQKSAERTVERKLEQKTEKETGKVMDSILDPSQKSAPKKAPTNTSDNANSKKENGPSSAATTPNNANISDNLEVYSKFDFVPGDKILFYDDFSQDFIGDFPSKWNTNGSGAVVKLNSAEGNWFELKSGHGTLYIPDLNNLPEDYTIEFDLMTSGMGPKTTSSSAFLEFYISDNDALQESSKNQVKTSFPLCQYNTLPIYSKTRFNGTAGSVDSRVNMDIREELLNQPHIAIAITKNRYRVWVNERKAIDIPRMIEEQNVLKHIKFGVVGLKNEVERIFISNIRVADGGEDLRRKLLTEGKISTNGILFDSGSANIKPQSMGIVLQISQVLLQDENIRLNIVGHTDADGNSDTNQKLSKDRAESVKNALVNLYNIPANRLQTDGKGASTPVADNTTADGKAQNRRVEFIKI